MARLNVQLTVRSCQCGCGDTFKVWPETSPCWFKNSQHLARAMRSTDPSVQLKVREFIKAKIELSAKREALVVKNPRRARRFWAELYSSDLYDPW
jgi:hypothetical protein